MQEISCHPSQLSLITIILSPDCLTGNFMFFLSALRNSEQLEHPVSYISEPSASHMPAMSKLFKTRFNDLFYVSFVLRRKMVVFEKH